MSNSCTDINVIEAAYLLFRLLPALSVKRTRNKLHILPWLQIRLFEAIIVPLLPSQLGKPTKANE